MSCCIYMVGTFMGVELLVESHRPKGRAFSQTPNTIKEYMLVRMWGLSSMFERETAQIAD